MDTDTFEARNIESYKIRAVCAFDSPLAVAEIMLPRCCIIYHLDFKPAFGSLAIAYFLLVAGIFSISDDTII